MALTSADLARLGPQAQKQVLDKLVGEQKSKKSKYGNRKVVRDGIKFDSERERIKPMVYRADFVYERATGPDCNGTVHWLREVEDAKGVKTKDYLLKKKLMQDKYGITIREV